MRAAAPLDEPFDTGVFTAKPGDRDFTTRSVELFERRQVHAGRQTVAVMVDAVPPSVDVDPYNERIDRSSDHNLTRVGGGRSGRNQRRGWPRLSPSRWTRSRVR